MPLLTRKNDRVAVLTTVPLFAGLSQRELGDLARHVTELTLEIGSTLTREGDKGREAMVLLQGEASVLRGGRKVAQLTPGDIVGEMSLVTSLPRNATVRADTDVVVLHIDRRDFASLMDDHPKVAVKVLKTVVERLADRRDV